MEDSLNVLAEKTGIFNNLRDDHPRDLFSQLIARGKSNLKHTKNIYLRSPPFSEQYLHCTYFASSHCLKKKKNKFEMPFSHKIFGIKA